MPELIIIKEQSVSNCSTDNTCTIRVAQDAVTTENCGIWTTKLPARNIRMISKMDCGASIRAGIVADSQSFEIT